MAKPNFDRVVDQIAQDFFELPIVDAHRVRQGRIQGQGEAQPLGFGAGLEGVDGRGE